MNDMVNHPPHYQLVKDVEAISIIEAALSRKAFLGYLIGNALKYRLRAGKKGDSDKAIEDLDKAMWYENHYNQVISTRSDSDA